MIDIRPVPMPRDLSKRSEQELEAVHRENDRRFIAALAFAIVRGDNLTDEQKAQREAA